MNGEKPKFKPWKDIVNETKESIKIQEQNLLLAHAVLVEAEKRMPKE